MKALVVETLVWEPVRALVKPILGQLLCSTMKAEKAPQVKAQVVKALGCEPVREVVGPILGPLVFSYVS